MSTFVMKRVGHCDTGSMAIFLFHGDFTSVIDLVKPMVREVL